MTRDWHSTFSTWAKPPGENEEKKASNAADDINKAIRNHPALAGKRLQVYASGSYRNNTNIKSESDIDVAVVSQDLFFYELPQDGSLTPQMLGFSSSSSYSFERFREDVGKALVEAFGPRAVTPGDKAFDVRETGTRLDADVSVFLEHRRYTGAKDANGAWAFHTGVEMRPRSDSGRRIINWHQQHYDEGVKRNTETRRRFKRVVRILKRLRDELGAGDDVPSFLIECLCFNASDSCFNKSEHTYYDDVAAVIAELESATGAPDRASKLWEVNRLKRLFGSENRWNPESARELLRRARQHVGLK